ncbi:MAG: PepSY domain-containing protein [Nanoarchaeota archaeon]
MKAIPQIGDSYKQEYYKGEAEDAADVLSLKEIVNVHLGNFTNCLKTKDYTPLEPNIYEYKYYCPEINNVVLELVINDNEQVKLINIEKNSGPSPSYINKLNEIKKGLIEEEAKQIALKEVPGKVTDVEIEFKFGRKAYVIEINNGKEIDVIIDFETGEVLEIES